MRLALYAFAEFLRYEFAAKFGGFKRVCASVRNLPVADSIYDSATIAGVCDAVELAACFYWKPMLCLPRSVVTTRLLRKRGVPAQLVIGYQPSPFQSHAWVEVGGKIIQDSRISPVPLLELDRL